MRAIAVVLGILIVFPAAAQDAVIGIWQTQADDNGNFGHVRIYPCGSAICGQLIRAFDDTGSEVESEQVGKRILWDMSPKGGGDYADGKIYAPDRDRTYSSRMELAGNTLRVSGCILGICRGRTGLDCLERRVLAAPTADLPAIHMHEV
jgi:uncharacterized protein (DUF2147 family)